MVQVYYYESVGKSCQKLLEHEGYPTKVLLYPYESWARPAALTFWQLKRCWWSGRRLKVVEVSGGRRVTTRARLTDTQEEGCSLITGKFKDGRQHPYFTLSLTSKVSETDFMMGYLLAGTVEQSSLKHGPAEVTHVAMVKRRGY